MVVMAVVWIFVGILYTCWNIFTVVQEPRGQYRDLFVVGFRRTILLLWLLWFTNACVYYGIVLSQSEILERGGVCAGRVRICHLSYQFSSANRTARVFLMIFLILASESQLERPFHQEYSNGWKKDEGDHGLGSVLWVAILYHMIKNI